jgi:hypothetical protein
MGRVVREKSSNLVDVTAEKAAKRGRPTGKWRDRTKKSKECAARRRNARFTIARVARGRVNQYGADARLARSLARKCTGFATLCCRISVVKARRPAAARLHHLQFAPAS